MANENKDVLRVTAVESTLDATIRNKQIGMATDTYRLGANFSGTIRHYSADEVAATYNAKRTIQTTTEQLRLGYDASYYVTHTVGSDGALTLGNQASSSILTVGSTEALEVNGAMIVGDAASTTNGTLRYTGTDFEGYLSGGWVSLTDSGPLSSVSNGADDRIATFSGSDSLNGEANLTFDGSILTLTDTTPKMYLTVDGGTAGYIKFTGLNDYCKIRYSDTGAESQLQFYGDSDGSPNLTVYGNAATGGVDIDADLTISKPTTIIPTDSGTNDLVDVLTVARRSSGTVAAGFGLSRGVQLETDDDNLLDAFTEDVYWDAINYAGLETLATVKLYVAGGMTAYLSEGIGINIDPRSVGGTQYSTRTLLAVANTANSYDPVLSAAFESYSSFSTACPVVAIRHSAMSSIGSHSPTGNYSLLGMVSFEGSSSTSWLQGAMITAKQSGANGTYSPTNLIFETRSASAVNSDQFVLMSDGTVRFGSTSGTSETMVVDTADAKLQLYNASGNVPRLEMYNLNDTTAKCQMSFVTGTHETWGTDTTMYDWRVDAGGTAFDIWSGYNSAAAVRQMRIAPSDYFDVSNLELVMQLQEATSEPTITNTGGMILWKDTGNSDRIYLVFKRATSDQVKVELT